MFYISQMFRFSGLKGFTCFTDVTPQTAFLSLQGILYKQCKPGSSYAPRIYIYLYIYIPMYLYLSIYLIAKRPYNSYSSKRTFLDLNKFNPGYAPSTFTSCQLLYVLRVEVRVRDKAYMVVNYGFEGRGI